MTAVKLDAPVVTNLLGGNYKIEVTGTLSLAKGDTFVGFRMTFTDPNMQNVTPTLNSFTAPQSGGTSTFKYTVYTTTLGTWKIDAAMDYTKADGSPGNVFDSKTAKVGP